MMTFPESRLLRLTVASALGTAIEWYDFFIYALVAPLVFDTVFFPKFSPLVGTIAVYSSLAVGFLARPLGGVLFGHLADRVGRRSVLLATILVMGLATTSIGFLPGYSRLGITAPILLVSLRFLQGLALGGEAVGASVLIFESAPSHRRGVQTAFIQAAGPLGVIGASAMVSVLSRLGRSAFMSWGWRLSFLASVVLVIMAVYIRAHVEESPAFMAASSKRRVQAPIRSVLENYRTESLLAFSVCLAETAYYYLTTIFAVGYGTKVLGMDQSMLAASILTANSIALIAVPYFGWLSDRFERRSMLLAGLLGASISIGPFFLALRTTRPVVVVLAMIVSVGVIHPIMFAAEASFIPELFDSEVRVTGASFGKQLGTVLGGGLAPLIATSLLERSHGSATPLVAYFILLATPALLSLSFAGGSVKQKSAART